MQRKRTVIGGAAAAAGLIIVMALPAHAIPLFKFKGTVRDAIGRAMALATVSDGTKSAVTASNGTYTLAEESTGRYTLNSFRSDTVTTTRVVDVTVPLDTTVDFTLYYKISGVLSRSALSTASGPASATLTVTNSAPNPGSPGQTGGKSCVYVTDSRSGLMTLATYVSTNPTTGASTWTHLLDLAQGTAQGSYQLSLAAKDCATGTLLTSAPAPTTSYVVDNTAPTLLTDSILPTNHGNTMFAAQRMFAKATDQGGSGLATSSYEVTDLDTGSTSAPAGTFDGTWLKTVNPLSLILGHTYRVAVTASDNAGNVDTETVEFLASSASANAAKARIPVTRVTMSPTVGTSRTITFPDVDLKVDPTVVHLGPSAHPGFGYVQQQVVVRQAKVAYYVGNVKVGETTPTNNVKSKDRIVYRQFVDSKAQPSPRDIMLGAMSVGIGAIDAVVPSTATAAEISLDVSVPVTPVTCVDPAAGLAACSPDPVRFFLPDEVPARSQAVQTSLLDPCLQCQEIPPSAYYELIMLLLPVNGTWYPALPPVPVAERYYGWIEWPEWTLPADEWATACQTNFRCVYTPTTANASADGQDNDGHVRYSHVGMDQFVWGEGVNGDPVHYSGICGPNQSLQDSCLYGFYGASNMVYYEDENGNTYWGAASINGRDVLDGLAINFSGDWMNPLSWGSGAQQHYIDKCGFGVQSRPLLYTSPNHAGMKYAQWRGGGYGCDGKGYISWAAGVGIETIKPQFENKGGGFVMRWEHLHKDWQFDFTFSLGTGGPSIGTNPQETTDAFHVYQYMEGCCVF